MGVDNLRTIPPEAILDTEQTAWREISVGQFVIGTAGDAEVARKNWKFAMRIYPLRKIAWNVMEKIESVSKLIFKSL